MTKKIKIVYDSNINKKELYFNAKKKIKNIHNSLKKNHHKNPDKILKKYLDLDKSTDNYFRILFFLSLYCSYIHKIKHKINTSKLSKLTKECYKKYNFVILDLDNSHTEILQDISTFFNTDSQNIEPITGKILYDLYNINVQFQQKQKKNNKKRITKKE